MNEQQKLCIPCPKCNWGLSAHKHVEDCNCKGNHWDKRCKLNVCLNCGNEFDPLEVIR